MNGVAKPYYLSMCNVGIMGTKYVRDTALSQTVFTVEQGSTQYFYVEKIRSEMTIGNELSIHMRTSIPGVSFTDFNSTHTRVQISPGFNPVGSYPTELQSYD